MKSTHMEAACEFSEGREGGGWLVVASAAFAQHRKGIWGETHKRTGVRVFCVFCFFLFDLFVWFLRMGVFAATGKSSLGSLVNGIFVFMLYHLQGYL